MGTKEAKLIFFFSVHREISGKQKKKNLQVVGRSVKETSFGKRCSGKLRNPEAGRSTGWSEGQANLLPRERKGYRDGFNIRRRLAKLLRDTLLLYFEAFLLRYKRS